MTKTTPREQQLEALVEAMSKTQAEQDKAQAVLHAENVRLRKELENAKR